MAEESLSSLHTEIAHHLLTGCHRQQNKTTSTFNFKPRISHPQKTYGELPEDLRRHYKEQIFPDINRELQPFFESDRRGELVTIAAYMVGKSKTTMSPTVLFIGGDAKTREGAKKAIEKSQIMAQHPPWQLDHTADFPRLSEMCNEVSMLEDFEFWSSQGTAKWRDQNNDTDLARDVYLDLRPYREQPKTLAGRGLPIYIQQRSGLRLATANIVRLNNRTFLQTVHHAFCLQDNKTETPGSTLQPKDAPTLPSVDMLDLIGHLLVCSVDRDWALIEVSNDEMNSLMNRPLMEDKDAHWVFQSAGRPSSINSTASAWTATNGELEVVLSETTTYTKLPNSTSFQEIHRAHLKNGSWLNGDSGAVIVDLATKLTFGHVLGGSRSKGVAFVIAADQVVEDFQQLDFSSHLHDIGVKRAHKPKLIAESTVFETGELGKVIQDFTRTVGLLASSKGFQAVSEQIDRIPKLQKELEDANARLHGAEKAHKAKLEGCIDAHNGVHDKYKTEKGALKDEIKRCQITIREREVTISDFKKKEDELKSAGRKIEDGYKTLKARFKDKELECEKLKEMGEGNKKRIDALTNELRVLRQEKSSLEQTIERTQNDNARLNETLTKTQERLKAMQGLSVVLKDEDTESLGAEIDQLWESATTLTRKYIAQDFPDEVLKRSWEKLNSTIPFAFTPLPKTNTPAAKELRTVKVLGLISSLLDRYIFQPTFHLAEDSQFKEVLCNLAATDPLKEQYLRGIMLSIHPEQRDEAESGIVKLAMEELLRKAGVEDLITHEVMGAFKRELQLFLIGAQDVWQVAQFHKYNITPYYEYEKDDGVEWTLYDLKTKVGAGGSNGPASRQETPNDIIILFPRVYAEGVDGGQPLNNGTVVQKSEIDAVWQEEQRTQTNKACE